MTLNLEECPAVRSSLAGASGRWGLEQSLGREAELVCKVEAEVPTGEVTPDAVPLFPVVYVKEELPEDPLEGICMKAEPLSDESCEEDSSNSPPAAHYGDDSKPPVEQLEEQGWATTASFSSSLGSCPRYRVTAGGKFQCSECELVDDTEESVKFHFTVKHSCPELCRPSQGALADPVERSNAQPYTSGLQFRCSQCEFSTFAKSHFKKHMLAKHSGVRPFKCDLCEYSTAYKNHLNRHILVKHSNTKPFQCLECEYSSAYKNHLKQHVLAKHSGVRPYQCTQCEYSSSYKNHLKQHTMIKHSGVKPYQCSECQFSTAEKNHLKKHTIIKHSGIKRFQCSQCEHSSAYKGNLRIHFRAKHSSS